MGQAAPVHAVRQARHPISASRSHPPLRPSPSIRPLLRGPAVQAKLKVGAANDPAEAEADRIADRVMRMPEAYGQSTASISGPPISPMDGGVSVRRLCAGCEEDLNRKPSDETARREMDGEDDFVQAKEAPGAASTLSASSEGAIQGMRSGGGRPLPASERAFFEPRFGSSFANVRIHDGASADTAAKSINARAFTLGNTVAFAKGEYRPGAADGRRLMAHELTHTLQQAGSARRSVQRAMKFELQVKKNKIYGSNGVDTPWSLPRKFGPADHIIKDPTGVRLESETHGQIEFETGWERKRTKLVAQIDRAVEMVKAISATPPWLIGGEPYRKFPFNIDHLRSGGWKVPKGKRYENNSKPGHMDRPLPAGQDLYVRVRDPGWRAYIQTSESFDLDQFETFLEQYETNSFDPSDLKRDGDGNLVKDKKPRTTAPFNIVAKSQSITDDIIAAVNTGKVPTAEIASLRNFLLMIVNYVIRGQFPVFSPIKGATKYTFALMNRTHFASIYKSALNSTEQSLFRRFVSRSESLLLTKLGLGRDSLFFIHGQGTSRNPINPKILTWLEGIPNGKDLLSSRDSSGRLSGAMGRFKIDQETGKQKGLVRYEVRSTPGNSADAAKWSDYAKKQFDEAKRRRPRPNGKGETGLD